MSKWGGVFVSQSQAEARARNTWLFDTPHANSARTAVDCQDKWSATESAMLVRAHPTSRRAKNLLAWQHPSRRAAERMSSHGSSIIPAIEIAVPEETFLRMRFRHGFEFRAKGSAVGRSMPKSSSTLIG